MGSTLYLGDGLRGDIIRVLSFAFLPFALVFLYLDYNHHSYIADYRSTQKQEERVVTKNISTAIQELKALTTAMGKMISSSPEDHRKIQLALASGSVLSQDTSTPTIQYITYYKLSGLKAIITPCTIAPLYGVPLTLQKPVKELESMAYQNNEIAGSLPVLDKCGGLIGVLQIKIPFLDIQKFVGVDKMTTLEFPQMFNAHGKPIIQKNPFEFSYKMPLLWYDYITSYASYFGILAFGVGLGCIALPVGCTLARKRTSLAHVHRIESLSKDLDHLSASRSSLEVYNSLHQAIIQRFKKMNHIIYNSMKYIE